jgi:hypothetical protein
VSNAATAAPEPQTELEAVRDRWSARWPDALALWSPFTRLRAPVWCLTAQDEQREGLTGSFAMIRLVDQTVVISLRQIVAEGLAAHPLEILGHEIGHHILCPADLADNARMLARVRRSLPSVEQRAPMIANLFADALINDRLQRARGLDMAGVYAALGGGADRLWTFYLRTYEILWALPTRTLTVGALDDRIEGDAQLGARLVRSFAGRWLEGAGRYGALCLPYLLDQADDESERLWRVWQDATAAGAGGFPDGLTEIDPDEAAGSLHPALDPELNGDLDGATTTDGRSHAVEPQEGTAQGSAGNYREPFQYGEILRASGLDLTDHEVAMRYYRERAMGHLIPFPSRRVPVATDPLPEGVETWDVGAPLADIDWIETVTRSPVVVPGITTMRRQWGTSEGNEPDRVPIDLDIYIDSSGSMPDPQVTVSYLTLAGAIVALSALRAGASVQATLWSGTNQFVTTNGFVRDEQAVLRVMTGFFGGGTAFPIHVARDTYATRTPSDPPAHVLIVSDDGVTTMYDRDEAGRDGGEVMRGAIAQAGGGATMVLNLWGQLENDPQLLRAQADGWDIHVVREWADLVAFARAFSRTQYEEPGRPAGARA